MYTDIESKFEVAISSAREPILILRGEVGYNNVPKIESAVENLIDDGMSFISVDARELTFSDSASVLALVKLAKTVMKMGGKVRLIPSESQLSRILTSAELLKLFKLQNPEKSDVMEFEVPSRPDMVSYIRARAVDFASRMPFTIDDIEDIKLAVGEASTNAIRHGANSHCCNVGVRLEKHLDAMKICISDKGCGFDPDIVRVPSVDDFSEGGRGIIFMKALMDEVKFQMCNPGTSVELTKRFH